MILIIISLFLILLLNFFILSSCILASKYDEDMFKEILKVKK